MKTWENIALKPWDFPNFASKMLQHAYEKMASFTADGAALNLGQDAGIKALILGINASSTS